MRYFRLSDDVYVSGRWHLDDPADPPGSEFDLLWRFGTGFPVDIEGRPRIPIDIPGRPLDFTETPVGGVPVVHATVAALFAKLAPKDTQLIPVDVDEQPDELFILNVTRVVKCIDDKASDEVQYWKPEDGRPEKTGNYRSVIGMRIDTSKVGDAKVFRPRGWMVALLVSEEIKVALEHIGAIGARFTEV